MSRPKTIRMPDGHRAPVIAYERGLFHHLGHARLFVQDADLGGEGLPMCIDPDCREVFHFAKVDIAYAMACIHEADKFITHLINSRKEPG